MRIPGQIPLSRWWSGHDLVISHRLLLAWLCLVHWAANFSLAGSFGFYDDDWGLLAPAWVNSWRATHNSLVANALHFALGRPLQFVFSGLFAEAGSVFQRLSFLYAGIFLLGCVAYILFYRVLLLKFPRNFSALVTLLCILSPLTTLHSYLNANSYKLVGLILLMGGILLYARHKCLAYALAFAALLTQESLFFLFFSAPLFHHAGWSKAAASRLAFHTALCLALLGAYLALRTSFGEGRLVDIGHHHFGGAGIAGLTLTPLYYALRSFSFYEYAVQVASAEADWRIILGGALVCFPVIRLFSDPESRGEKALKWWLGNGVGLGIVLLLLGYALSYFEWNLDSRFFFAGRATRISTAAVFGSSLLVGALLYVCPIFFCARRGKFFGGALGFTVLVCLFSYCHIVQKDFAEAWAFQKKILNQVVMLTPDLREQSAIFIQAEDRLDFLRVIRSPRQASIGAEVFGFEAMLTAMNPTLGVRIIFAQAGAWPSQLAIDVDEQVRWRRGVAPDWRVEMMAKQPFRPGRFIVLNIDQGGNLTRDRSAVYVDGQMVLQTANADGRIRAWKEWRTFEYSSLFRQMLSEETKWVLSQN